MGGALVLLALAFGLLACVELLSIWVARWIAAFIVAGAAGVVGAMLVAVGIKRMGRVAIGAPRTLASIEESLQWTNTPTR